MGVDVVLGADITYDDLVIPDLVKTIHAFVNQSESAKRRGSAKAKAYISAMPRNPATLETFVKEVEVSGMSIKQLHVDDGTRGGESGSADDDDKGDEGHHRTSHQVFWRTPMQQEARTKVKFYEIS